MRIPRPDRTLSLGTPNACNKCHADKTAAWAVQAVHTWYPIPKAGFQDFADAFDLGERGAPGAQAALRNVASAQSSSVIARASALTRLGRFSSPITFDLAAKALKDEDPAIRAAAVSVIANASSEKRRELLLPLLTDVSRLVRIDTARALADVPDTELSAEERRKREMAMAEYVDAQLFNAERPETLTDIGAFYRDRGKFAEAINAFEKATALDPSFVAAAVSLADIMREKGNDQDAEKILRNSLAANPKSAPVEHALGLNLIRQKRISEGIDHLAAAVRVASGDPHLSYVLAVALHDTGKTKDAIDTLKSELARSPYDREILWGLASYEAEAGDLRSAIDRLVLLSELEPELPSVSEALAALRRLHPNPQ
ncbi:MAG TPA: tetratricopeptide repeat protein [Hyphomicrobium sp.]|nr:tetratricopeptide repeat protein [Hyphomicrobium sp.]